VKEADSVGSVSIDEEMTQMMEAQRAFQAASRVLTAVDDMLSYLIERTGR
jgi:flagellar hook-associated protein 1 FlgK